MYDTDIVGDCKAPTCINGNPDTMNDDADEPPEKCKICSEGNIEDAPLKAVSYTQLTDSAKCPDHPIHDDTAQHEIDGCSLSPDDLESWDNLPGTRLYNWYVGNPPTWGTVLNDVSHTQAAEQTLPCNVHDICYQSCGRNKAMCDSALGAGITASCDIGYPYPCPWPEQAQCEVYEAEYQDCRGIGPIYALAVDLGGVFGFYENRQVEHCLCCKP